MSDRQLNRCDQKRRSRLGISTRSHNEQSLTANEFGIEHPLLSDDDRLLTQGLISRPLRWRTSAGIADSRLSSTDGAIAYALNPITSATRSSAQAIAWMSRGSDDGIR